MTTSAIGILSYDEMKARTVAIAFGQLKPAPDEPKIWVPSTETLVRILSEPIETPLTEVIRSRLAPIVDGSRV